MHVEVHNVYCNLVHVLTFQRDVEDRYNGVLGPLQLFAPYPHEDGNYYLKAISILLTVLYIYYCSISY